MVVHTNDKYYEKYIEEETRRDYSCDFIFKATIRCRDFIIFYYHFKLWFVTGQKIDFMVIIYSLINV